LCERCKCANASSSRAASISALSSKPSNSPNETAASSMSMFRRRARFKRASASSWSWSWSWSSCPALSRAAYPSSANSSSSRAVLLFDHFFSHLCHGRANRGELVDERGASGSATMGGDISGGGATRAVRGGGIASLRGAATRERRDELRWEAPRREDCSSTAAV